jgi:thioredoxin-like negative regulator of GroEL
MAYRRLLIATAVLSSLIGALVVWLALTVPRDLKSDALLKQARKELDAGHREKSRQSLALIVQQYPRTDAAGAATLALLKMSEQEVRDLSAVVETVKRDHEDERRQINALTSQMGTLRKPAPAPAPVVAAPPPAPKPVVKPAAKKPPVKKATHRRRRR